jgi:hypothetical protein
MYDRPRLQKSSNWHHVFFERRLYNPKVPIEVAFREHPALVVPMNRFVHNELHREITSPSKPTHEQMLKVVGALGLWDSCQGRLSGVIIAQHQFDMMGRTDIADNMAEQIKYMECSTIKEYSHGI